MSTTHGSSDRVRVDKWLWAARFYKTRTLAKTAVEGGKVHVNDARVKAARAVGPGDVLTVTRTDGTSQTVVVVAVSERRGSATIAQTLYTETPESIEDRESTRAAKRMERAGLRVPAKRPSKRDRRQLVEMKSRSVDR